MERDPRELASSWVRFQRHELVAPAPDLAPFVERYWTVEWDYAEPYRQLIMPYPNVHLTFPSDGPAQVRGVSSRHVVRELRGSGRVVGVAFRPGAFRTFLGAPVSSITDRAVAAAEVFGPGVPARPDVDAVEELLRSAGPRHDPTAEWAGAVVRKVAAEPAIRRVDELAARFGTTVRRLQRVSADHVGVGPKWLIRRYRLHEVTERMASGEAAGWAGLAVELGYADQAHLVRDFAAMFGEPPTRYAARY